MSLVHPTITTEAGTFFVLGIDASTAYGAALDNCLRNTADSPEATLYAVRGAIQQGIALWVETANFNGDVRWMLVMPARLIDISSRPWDA